MATKYDFSSATGIKKFWGSVSNRASSLQDDIQKGAVATLVHIQQHGDWTLARDGIEGITASKGVKARSLQLWFEAFMHATYAEGDDGKFAFTYDEGHDASTINLEQAKVVNWYDMKPPKKDTSKDLGEIQVALAKMLKASAKAGKVTPEQVAILNSAVKAMVRAAEDGNEVEFTFAYKDGEGNEVQPEGVFVPANPAAHGQAEQPVALNS